MRNYKLGRNYKSDKTTGKETTLKQPAGDHIFHTQKQENRGLKKYKLRRNYKTGKSTMSQHKILKPFLNNFLVLISELKDKREDYKLGRN